ncbi:MAG: phosphatase PAP2 family protein [Chthoniobacteraceae bacterium]
MDTDAKDLERSDIELGEKLASKRHDPAVRKASKVGKLGDQEPLYAAAGAALLFALATRRLRLTLASIATLAAVGGADAGKTLAKRSVHRTRPHVTLDDDRYERGVGGTGNQPEQSFPSGHVACTAAAARALSRHYPASAPWGVLATLIIAFARLVKGAHWPLDVAAGLVIGLTMEAVTSELLRVVGVRGR